MFSQSEGEGWEKAPTRVLLIGAFNQQKALVGAFSMIVKTPGRPHLCIVGVERQVHAAHHAHPEPRHRVDRLVAPHPQLARLLTNHSSAGGC